MTRIALVVTCLIVVLAVPLWADEATIPLEHANPADIHQLFTPPEPGAEQPTGGGGHTTGGGGHIAGGGGHITLPEGIEEIEAVIPQNALRVVGTEEGIAELREMLEMLDWPRRPVRITVRKLATDDPGALQEALWAADDRTVEAALWFVERRVLSELVDDGIARVVSDRALEIANGEAAMLLTPGSARLVGGAAPGAGIRAEVTPTFVCHIIIAQIHADDSVRLSMCIDETLNAWRFGEKPLVVGVRLEPGKLLVLSERDDAGDLVRPVYVFGAEVL